jgi:arylsulfatase A-like enzyme
MVDVVADFDHTEIDGYQKVSAAQLTDKVLSWIREQRERPAFVYVHYHGAHAPYWPPEPYRSLFHGDALDVENELAVDHERTDHVRPGSMSAAYVRDGITNAGYYIALYDGAIAAVDAQIARLVAGLEEMDVYRGSAVVITADHGELLGEHEIYFDHVGCFEPVLRVPLLFKFPEQRGAGRVDSRLVSLVDIAPTVLDLAGVETPRSTQGTSLVKLLEDETLEAHSFVYSRMIHDRSVRSPRWKLVFNGVSCALFDLATDPGEEHDVAEVNPAILDDHWAAFKRWEGGAVPPGATTEGSLSAEQRQLLKDLGYLREDPDVETEWVDGP